MLRRTLLGFLFAVLCRSSLLAATFIVTTTADSGLGSLDQVILDANANSGLDTIHFNIAGGGPQVITTGALPIITDPVVIDGTTQPGYAGTPIITLDGNDTIGGELRIQSSSPSTIRGLAIVDMLGTGVRVENGGATIRDNYIGVNATGLVADGNASHGIEVRPNVDGVVILGNVVSGNNGHGIFFVTAPDVAAPDNNIVQGNVIGLDAPGTNDLGNLLSGIALGGNNNQIGGPAAGEGNVISGNGGTGITVGASGSAVTLAVGNRIQGNRIGTNQAGTAAVPNSFLAGIALFGPDQTNISGNVISGNAGHGLFIVPGSSDTARVTTNTVITGNLIGTNVNGTAPLGNALNGILLGMATNTVIGSATAGNVISGNGASGIFLSEAFGGTVSGTVVQGNRIGTDNAGTAAIPNADAGITIGTTTNSALITGNTIGGTGAGEGNRIWFNLEDGIAVLGGAGNRILGNLIDQNGELGIDLAGDGVTANDAGDPDLGPNNRQNYPLLTGVAVTASTTVTGTFNSTPSRAFRIELFGSTTPDPSGFGEGATFLGFTNVSTDGAGVAAISATLPPVAPGTYVTATATDQTTQDTSEFSNAVAAVFVPPVLNIGDFTGLETNSGTTNATFTVTLSEASSMDVTFQFSTADETATAGSDYTQTMGSGTIPAGATTTTITVPILGDAMIEPNETFLVTITTVTGATAGDAQGRATIQNDDGMDAPTLAEGLLALLAILLAAGGVMALRGNGL
ncbi:MAG TPA: right-handed parallel beta-helix repeat-containing protein [Thermoanaerobaculia bacterium]|nr:right-handed parallel beta-helix repeat-containing protein [Thermoanaerobaculia bacterium]